MKIYEDHTAEIQIQATNENEYTIRGGGKEIKIDFREPICDEVHWLWILINRIRSLSSAEPADVNLKIILSSLEVATTRLARRKLVQKGLVK